MAQSYPLHIHEYPLHYIDLKYLPESALEELADILDVPGIVCMELFAEMINREHENKLGLHTSRVQAFRYQVGQRPTKILFRHLMALGISIGQVQYVLDEMGAATRHIFRKYYNDCIQMFSHDMAHPSTSTGQASENNCTCTGCEERNAHDLYYQRYVAERYLSSLSNNRRPDGQRQYDPNNQRYVAEGNPTSRTIPHPTSRRSDGQRQNDPNNQRYIAERDPTSRTNQNPTSRRPDGQRQNDPNNQRYVAERSPTSRTNQNNRRPERQRQNIYRHENTDLLRYEGRLPHNAQPSQRENLHAHSLQQNAQPEQREIELDWIHPSECDCECGDTNCKECEERRLLDPDETTVLSSYPRREYRNKTTTMRRSNNLSSRTTGHMPVNDEMNINDIQTDYVSYSENPSSSFCLRACPDGNSHSSMKSSITSKHACSNTDTLKCTCKKPPVCTCRKKEVHLHKQMSQPSSSSSGDNRKRLSTPDETLYASEIDSSRLSVPSISDSDPNLCPNLGDRRTTLDQSGKNIFISYTDDAKADVIILAGEIKRQGHSVNTDLHKESFVSAKNQGFVSEKDQYTWLRNRYTHADYIIICSSKGYIEAINMDKVQSYGIACPQKRRGSHDAPQDLSLPNPVQPNQNAEANDIQVVTLVPKPIGLLERYEKKSVWIIGSSNVKHAFTHAHTTSDGINLGLKRENCTISWQGKHIFLSYTDDAKADVINLAGEIKRQGHSVNTDLPRECFVLAKNQGFVSEQDQYTWLRNRYTNADYIIICSSKGYNEATNLDKGCPNPHYLNARFIFELIMQDPRKSEKIIEIFFQNTNVNDKLCLPFTRKFILPNQMASLSNQIRR
ncbi:unnamed protein product [Mytilus coruscus]|uniref:SEFIR domain-containing protein n=1 Tax=Mytilus coruscus TaxID=42192 RepID=A0A6J8ANJ0_MYTCO|nr:unnamed protein product [Mytilus coruscus]